MPFNQSLDEIKQGPKGPPEELDGRESVLELKEADYNRRRTKWRAFYFKHKCRLLLRDICEFPGDGAWRFCSPTFSSRAYSGPVVAIIGNKNLKVL